MRRRSAPGGARGQPPAPDARPGILWTARCPRCAERLGEVGTGGEGPWKVRRGRVVDCACGDAVDLGFPGVWHPA